MASLRAARSAGDAASLAAGAGRAGRLAACGVDAAVVAFVPTFAGALVGRGFGRGTPPADSAATATTRVPVASRTVKDRVGVRMLKSRPVRPPSAMYSLRSEEHTSELQSLRHLVCR